MVKTTLTHDRSQAGFTLVELAIVMIIIGLLIGGILKGQELIANAQITATASQVKAIEAAMTTFRDSYSAVPGDMRTPATRLPNCGAGTLCATAGDGNNRVDDSAPGAAANSGEENSIFWTHLAAADMIGGVSSTSNDIAGWGGQLPAAEVGGGFTIGFAAGALGLGNAVQGHYLALKLQPADVLGAAAGLSVAPTQAARIDRKLDDGVPDTGGVLAEGTNCEIAAGGVSTYNEADTDIECGLYARVQ